MLAPKRKVAKICDSAALKGWYFQLYAKTHWNIEQRCVDVNDSNVLDLRQWSLLLVLDRIDADAKYIGQDVDVSL